MTAHEIFLFFEYRRFKADTSIQDLILRLTGSSTGGSFLVASLTIKANLSKSRSGCGSSDAGPMPKLYQVNVYQSSAQEHTKFTQHLQHTIYQDYLQHIIYQDYLQHRTHYSHLLA